MKNLVITLIVIALVIFGIMFFLDNSSDTLVDPEEEGNGNELGQDGENGEDSEEDLDETQTVIGSSVEGRDISAYHFGSGEEEILFVGGIHGGYSWNTALVAYEIMDHFEENLESIPENVKVTVIPVLNPDGLQEVVGSAGRFSPSDVPSSEEATITGRFNANDVDLNRNFDCDWQSDAVWQSQSVSGGTEVFSEPEARAIRDYVEMSSPAAVVVYYSAAGGVFASNCHDGVLAQTTEITNVYADASGYPSYQSFDFYKTTGDMVNWLAKEGIPGISVLLSDHQNLEWDKNRAGVEALIKHYEE